MPSKEIVEGNAAPNFSLPANNGEQISLSGFKGKWVVLYFYPKDDTPGCTKEAYGAFKKKGMFGKTFLGIERSTFLINPEGKIAKIWRNVKVDGHEEAVLKEIK